MLIVSGSFQIKAMMEENESLTDMEKLKQQEFNLDVQEQQRLQLEGEQEVTRVNTTVIYRWLRADYLYRHLLYKQAFQFI